MVLFLVVKMTNCEIIFQIFEFFSFYSFLHFMKFKFCSYFKKISPKM